MEEDVPAALRNAVRDCSDRGLSVAAKWASELLLSISPSKLKSQVGGLPSAGFHTSTPARPHSPRSSMAFATRTPAHETAQSSNQIQTVSHPHAPRMQPPPLEVRTREMQLEIQEADHIVTGQAMMNAKEYTRAVHWLRDCQSAKAVYLRVYCEFLASEKKAMRDWYRMNNTRHQPQVPVNPALFDLLQAVHNSTDPWHLFLKALFLLRLSRREEAIESALLSIAAYPWNWSAWTLLGECLGDGEEVTTLSSSTDPFATDTSISTYVPDQNIQQFEQPNGTDAELSMCDKLLGEEYFPRSLWLMAQRAFRFGNAEAQFKKLRAIDPYRIDDIDVYSNILYVSENRLELSKLAHEFLPLEKDRPEICCLVGNHYSLRGEHEKAIKYFRRATQLDRTYLSAWTLMGHEYVEMKNSHAAIEAYRKAVDVNRKDFRAWYGLGQAYELLGMHQYAVYYYQHATALRPYDVRIWQAQGMCYEEMGRLREAIECMKRALLGADPREITIHIRLARLHADLEEFMESAAYHQRVIDVCTEDSELAYLSLSYSSISLVGLGPFTSHGYTSVADHILALLAIELYLVLLIQLPSNLTTMSFILSCCARYNKPPSDYAYSSLCVARYHLLQGGGDFLHARDLMEVIAGSQCAEVGQATELLKRIKMVIMTQRANPTVVGAEERK
ncbi:Anaphase-promoting complex subunit 23 [Steccherinum ochraceum]|uniref:Anaphase-promoting complex subunit 23 n=1 Tax=Steccherinum ochraceum TaxID=92696 RepID=A0A4R0S181_9APHY|nr:Anaphase-promoting complex subunit 23 [Steccherinum ochraceum]